MDKFFEKKDEQKFWISISDMMSALMMIFLFIAISYMINVTKEKDKIKKIAVTYEKLQRDIYRDLYNEFKYDLPKWDAILDRKTLSIKFQSPEVLFKQGSYELKPLFKEILADFFPRYLKILTSKKYKDEIEEVRIEGHTSSEWRKNTTGDKAYFNNMKLSQDRTRSVLKYVMLLPNVSEKKRWLKNYLTANGLSSSKLVFTNGIENKEKSRRVEFMVKTNAEKRIVKIIDEGV